MKIIDGWILKQLRTSTSFHSSKALHITKQIVVFDLGSHQGLSLNSSYSKIYPFRTLRVPRDDFWPMQCNSNLLFYCKTWNLSIAKLGHEIGTRMMFSSLLPPNPCIGRFQVHFSTPPWQWPSSQPWKMQVTQATGEISRLLHSYLTAYNPTQTRYQRLWAFHCLRLLAPWELFEYGKLRQFFPAKTAYHQAQMIAILSNPKTKDCVVSMIHPSDWKHKAEADRRYNFGIPSTERSLNPVDRDLGRFSKDCSWPGDEFLLKTVESWSKELKRLRSWITSGVFEHHILLFFRKRLLLCSAPRQTDIQHMSDKGNIIADTLFWISGINITVYSRFSGNGCRLEARRLIQNAIYGIPYLRLFSGCFS